MTDAALIETMTERIVGHFQPLQLILFGSQARGEATPMSDVDLLVVMPQISNKRQITIEIRRVLADLPVCKDIVLTTPEEIARRGDLVGTVLRPALREGKVLYERPEWLAEVQRWLRYAREALTAAEALLHQRAIVPRRHDLDALRQLIPDG